MSPIKANGRGAAKKNAHAGKRTFASSDAAFTLVEIMVVVVIIGLLAAIGIPAFLRAKEKSMASRYTNDFRQFDASFQRYATENGDWPLTAAAGVIPAGMAGYLPESFTNSSPMGGNYRWIKGSNVILLVNSNATDSVMVLVDTALDDGDLTTGNFIKLGGLGYVQFVK